MRELRNNLSVYWKFNKNILLGFIVFSLIFHLYCYSFIFAFGDKYEVRDFTFVFGYIVIIPGILTYLTFNKINLQLYFVLNKRSAWPLVINIIVPLLLSLLITSIYVVLRTLHINGMGEGYMIVPTLGMHLFSIPVVFYALLIILERKYQLINGTKSLIKVLIYVSVFGVIAFGVSFIKNAQLLENIRVTMIVIITVITPIYLVLKKYWRIDT
ncbi:MAG: hypothetical protein KQ78_00182 [Candidatus Izimaplasma bacterium HR2]|nr:MAG: hypothetical protein KQ78_00182 [Candidatus Izimaplasma bacterium HR2]